MLGLGRTTETDTNIVETTMRRTGQLQSKQPHPYQRNLAY